MENGNDERFLANAQYFRPIIEALKQFGGSAEPKEVVPKVIADMQIGSADDDEQKKLEKGIMWARNTLKNAGLISKEVHGVWSLTDEGWNIDLTVAAANNIQREENRRNTQKMDESMNPWLYDDYDTGITTEGWVELLNDATVFNEKSLTVVACIKAKGGAASCSELAESYGRSPGFYNAHSVHTAKRVADKTKCELLPNAEGGNKYWPILYVGKPASQKDGGTFCWKLRPALLEALNSVDLSKIILKENIADVDPHRTSHPKNLILYGPPGTGKTYHTMIYAVAIIEGSEIDDVRAEAADDFDAVSARFRKYLKDGRAAFTTFHQSFSYEEFIEGIRPVVDDADGASGEVRYRIVDGIFKTFCAHAQPETLSDSADSERDSYGMNRAPTVWKVSLQGTGDNPTRRECMENGRIRIGWDSYGPDITSETEITSGKGILEKFIYTMRVGDIVLSCWSASEIDAVGVVTGEYEWHDEYSSYKRSRSVRWLVKGIRENIVDMNGGSQMTLATVYKMKISVDDVMRIVRGNSDDAAAITAQRALRPCVFIIDEINRGNISKIFGELITLIEESKRTGCREELTSTLPYSRELFGVPDNVYIIGTMNTADRSIARLDTALRRRFTFREMMPEPELLDDTIVDGVNVGAMLRAMNARISALLGRDRQIGHSYFLQLRDKDNAAAENLADLFDDKILPLFEEYFYDDRDKIKMILGSALGDFYKSRDIQGEHVLERVAAPNFGDAYIKIYS